MTDIENKNTSAMMLDNKDIKDLAACIADAMQEILPGVGADYEKLLCGVSAGTERFASSHISNSKIGGSSIRQHSTEIS